MTISRVGTGTRVYGTTSVVPTYPTNAIGDRVYLLVIWKASVTTTSNGPTNPSGWDVIAKRIPDTSILPTGGYGAVSGTDTGNVGFAIYAKTVTTVLSGTLSITMTSTNVGSAVFYTFRKTSSSHTWDSDYYNYNSQTSTPTSPLAVAMSSVPLKTNDYIMCGMGIPTDVTTPSQFSAQSLSGSVTFSSVTEIGEFDTTTGGDLGGWIGSATVTAGDATGTVTVTSTLAGTLTNVRGPVFLFRVREVAPPPAPLFSTLIDAFDTKDAGLWNWPAPTDADVSGSSLFVFPGVYLQSTNKYTLNDSSVYFELELQSSGAFTARLHTINGDISTGTVPYISFDVSGILYIGIDVDYVTILYDPVDHRYFRFSHSASTFIFETSPNGSSWTTRKTIGAYPAGGEFYLTFDAQAPAPYQRILGVNAISSVGPTPTDYWGVAA